jgi:hypothetical protein
MNMAVNYTTDENGQKIAITGTFERCTNGLQALAAKDGAIIGFGEGGEPIPADVKLVMTLDGTKLYPPEPA